MLMRGFTTVRDAAGADFGLQEAVAKGLFEGPRLFIAGFPVSQTGGHADMRPKGVRNARDVLHLRRASGLIGAIADGVGEVRRAVREQVRNGANQIKIMAGGGISSPTDPLEGTQFSLDELRAACEEAEAANLYAMAHAYSPRAVTRAVQAGVRSIEHGNLIDEATARVMKQRRRVPRADAVDLRRAGRRRRAPRLVGRRCWTSWRRVSRARHRSGAASRAPRACRWCSAPTCSATCTSARSGEFDLRLPAMGAGRGAAERHHHRGAAAARRGPLGELVAGAWADLLLVDGDPTRELSMLTKPDEGIRLVVQAGRVVKDALGAASCDSCTCHTHEERACRPLFK